MNSNITLEKVNKYIQSIYPEIELVKGKGYFYVYSDNEEIGLKLSGLYTTSISVCNIRDLNLYLWLERVEYVLNDSYRYIGEREPVYIEKPYKLYLGNKDSYTLIKLLGNRIVSSEFESLQGNLIADIKKIKPNWVFEEIK